MDPHLGGHGNPRHQSSGDVVFDNHNNSDIIIIIMIIYIFSGQPPSPVTWSRDEVMMMRRIR